MVGIARLRPSRFCGAGRFLVLSRSGNVELSLQDVVDDWLTQVLDDVAVTVLQRQSWGRSIDRLVKCYGWFNYILTVFFNQSVKPNGKYMVGLHHNYSINLQQYCSIYILCSLKNMRN